MSSPLISVMKFGTALIFASHLRQSCSFAQYCASFCIVANCTPCVASATCSRSGHFVAAMRLRKSARSASGTLTRKGRIAVSPAAAAICAGSRLTAPAAADAARKLRRPSSGNLTVSMDDSPWSDGRLERREQAWRSASRARRWDWTICRLLLLALVGNARKLRLAGNLLAAPNAVFFARNRCLTRLCDVYDAQTTIRNSAHHDIRWIRVPLHAELRCSCLYFGFSLDYNSQCPLW